MPSPHPALRRPNLRPHPPLHPLLTHLPPFHNLIHHSLQQRPLRLILHKRPLRPRRRHPRHRTKRPRTRIPSRNRLALNGSQDPPLPPVFLSHFFFCSALAKFFRNITSTSSGRIAQAALGLKAQSRRWRIAIWRASRHARHPLWTYKSVIARHSASWAPVSLQVF
jgi:hypothetical protein